ncbi:hypothetical protein KKH13_05290 [Patescibacteria group bacterium]|uniref:Putative glycosyltransferase n=1 Tax=viral metagenome TaxID=1070528 RepID=A0A6M3KQR6_9ZZZZ|nr:hypothetical protein [Patescibacteria group bacterium]
MRIKVVIPTLLWHPVQPLINDLAQGTVRPEKIYVIDNSGRFYSPKSIDIGWVEIIFPGENIGVNASWNAGIELCADCDAVALLNDDIRVGRRFVEKIISAFDGRDNAGVVCPLTHDYPPGELPEMPVIRMRKREGWAMTIRKELFDKMPRIPSDRIRTFCGDDWIWHWAHRLGYRWYKDMGNCIRHEVGVSMAENPQIRATLRSEKEEFAKIIRELKAA